MYGNSWNLLEVNGLTRLGRWAKECSRICGVSGANFRKRMQYMDMNVYICGVTYMHSLQNVIETHGTFQKHFMDRTDLVGRQKNILESVESLELISGRE